MNYYAIRITKSSEELNGFYDIVERHNPVKGIFYEHTIDENVSRTHVHGLLVIKEGSDAIKNWVKKALNVKTFEPTDWIFAKKYGPKTDRKPVTEESIPGFITYMSKGKYDCKWKYNMEEYDLEELRRSWVNHNCDNKPVTISNNKKAQQNRLTKRQLIDKIHEGIRLTFPNETNHSVYDVVRVIKNVLICNNEVLGMYKVIDLYDAYLMYHCGESWIHEITAKINSRIRV